MRNTRAIRFGGWLAGVATVVVAWTYIWGPLRPIPAETLLKQARVALKTGAFEQAILLAQRVPARAPEYAPALLIVGEALTRRLQHEKAIEVYEQIPDDGSEESITAQYCTGDLWYHLGEASRAERCYRRVLIRRPDDKFTNGQLATLLGTFGRRFESLPYLFTLARRGEANVEQLLMLGNSDAVISLPPHIEKFEKRAPDDPLPALARARYALSQNDRVAAEKYARQVVEANPDLSEGWAVLGRSLVEADEARFLEWHSRVPRAADQHPDVWMARGLYARRCGQHREAVRCFLEAVDRAPESRAANYHLGQALLAAGPEFSPAATPYLDWAAKLEELEGLFWIVYLKQDSLPHLRQVAELSEGLGRLVEAAAWCRSILDIVPENRWARLQMAKLEPRLAMLAPSSRSIPGKYPRPSKDWWQFPLPQWSTPSANTTVQTADASAAGPRIAFVDSAREAGIEVTYFNGAQPATEGKLIFQTLGGGAAALDYDGDARPDLYFPQGAPWPMDHADHGYMDRFYRNSGDGHFKDVTRAARLGDARFSIGIAAGDFDNDGFADLYLSNLGANRLYRNQGDGTFRDVTDEAGISGELCHTSCLIADLNGDGVPDLFDVTYVAAPGVYEKTCEKDGVRHSCSPRLFDAEVDRLWLGRGDGSFEEVGEAAGIHAEDGKGLGVVAFDADGSGRLNLFVANDTVANFYFANTGVVGSFPRFREAALETGLAFDADGKAQACMGIAAGDADGDGLLDLYVTNFFEEPNTLYRRQDEALFADETRRFGLYEPSLPQLGFGTQFLDADLDGWLDILVTNGHIDDFSDRGKPHRMPPQFYRNLEGRRFEDLPAAGLGAYFKGRYLGRGLTRLDWNADGLEDAVITPLDTPVALLTNRTEAVGKSLTLRLVATRTSRDAIGATVRITAGGRTIVRQLTAGDGYLASNERLLIVGLGTVDAIEQLSVHWPSGKVERLDNVAPGQRLILVEGNGAPVPLP